MRLFTALLLFLIFNSEAVFSQGVFNPLNSDTYKYLDRFDIKYNSNLPALHSAVKPYSKKHISAYINSLDSLQFDLSPVDRKNLRYLKRDHSEWMEEAEKSDKPILKYFYREPASLYSLHKKNFTLKVNPVLQFTIGKETNNGNFLFTNTRGLELSAYISDKVGFYTYLTENQLRFPSYANQRIINTQAIPGEGFYKSFKSSGYDYFSASGYITFNFLKHFDLQFGHGKNFMGNGYRSILLSDFSNNYFYLKLQTSVWRIKYQNIFAELEQQYDRGADELLDKKYAAFHHLNINVTPWLDIGIFEGVVFNRSDHFEFQYLNPLIFYRSIEQELGSPDNALLGLDMKANILKSVSLYGQWLFDEFNFSEIKDGNGWWANKFAAQAGIKYIDILNIDNLDIQLEFNMARPYTYAHNSSANYTHYNQELAHPLGANFRELIAIVNYQPLHELNIRLFYMHYMKGIDTDSTNWGGNIFINSVDPDSKVLTVEQEFNNEIGQGLKQYINFIQLHLSYQLKHNIFLDAALETRLMNSESDKHNMIHASFGFRMNMPYRRYEF